MGTPTALMTNPREDSTRVDNSFSKADKPFQHTGEIITGRCVLTFFNKKSKYCVLGTYLLFYRDHC